MPSRSVESDSTSESEDEAPAPAYNKLLSMLRGRPSTAVTSDEESDGASGAESSAESGAASDGGSAEESDDGKAEDEQDEDESEDSADEAQKESADGRGAAAAAEEIVDKEGAAIGAESESETEDKDSSDDEDGGEESAFQRHFETGPAAETIEALESAGRPWRQVETRWPNLGRLVVRLPAVEDFPSTTAATAGGQRKLLDDDDAASKSVPAPAVPVCTGKLKLLSGLAEEAQSLTPKQSELLQLLGEYRDVLYTEAAGDAQQRLVRAAYCLHVLDHVMRSRQRVLRHNARAKKSRTASSSSSSECRDQGLVRPRVLILAPFRSCAVKIVETLEQQLLKEKGQVVNRDRFYNEFGGDAGDGEDAARKSRKPEDYVRLFAGNSDDAFRLGIAISKRTLKLYAGFYASDVLLASPLGLRTLFETDFDFLTSVEVLVMENTDVMFQQNWEHVVQVWQHLHLQPREQHGTDLNRVRLWALNGWSKHFRQNVILSAVALPEASALLSTGGFNWAGRVRVENGVAPASASVGRVLVQAPMTFHRFDAESAADQADHRFRFFQRTVLDRVRADSTASHVLVYIASYYDYVRVRNHLHRLQMDYGQACEYTPDGKLAQVRNRFFLGQKRLLLYTERLHFFRRLTIKGVRHIVFYQLPTYPHLYPELVNLMQEANQNAKFRGDRSQTCTVLYSAFDAQRLAGVVGSARAGEMLTSDRSVHMLVTGSST